MSSGKKKFFNKKKKQRLPDDADNTEQVPIKSQQENEEEEEKKPSKLSKPSLKYEKLLNDDHPYVANNMSINDSNIYNNNNDDVDWYKYNNNNVKYSTRLIERGSGSHPNVIIKGHIHSYLYLYHSIIDTPWVKLFFYGFLLFFAFNLIFGTLFHFIDGVRWTDISKNVTWSDSFFFALQSMDTIGFGALIPNHTGGNWLVFLMSYFSGIFWTAFTGIVFAKLSRPSRLKRQFSFSDVAVINNIRECFIPEFFDDDDYDNNTVSDLDEIRWSEYGEYKASSSTQCLIFRYGDMRHTSRICDSDFHLIFFRRSTRNDNEYEDYIMEEMDFEINRQKGRIRSLDTSTPLLSLPWIVIHKIDKLSPLYGLSKNDLIMQKCEIIAVVDGIDEATSDNFQSWWSYTANEIYWNYKFKPMVKAIVKSEKQFLQIDYDRISFISPITKKSSIGSNDERLVIPKKQKSVSVGNDNNMTL